MNLLQHAYEFLGLREIPGDADNGWIVWAHQLCGLNAPDETAWCSSCLNAWAFGCGLPMSKSAMARSWLKVGESVSLKAARPGNDIVILKRGEGEQPGPEVLNAPGHVGVFVGLMREFVLVLAGNQGNEVSIQRFPVNRILDLRRLRPC